MSRSVIVMPDDTARPILEAIAGISRSARGTVRVNDRVLDGLPPEARGVGYVPQDGLLFPHLDVDEVRHRGRSHSEAERGARLLEPAPLLGGLSPPSRDLGNETLAEVLRGNILVHNHCYRADEMAQMIDIAHEFGYKIRAFHHGVEAYKIADLLAKEGIAAAIWAVLVPVLLVLLDGPYQALGRSASPATRFALRAAIAGLVVVPGAMLLGASANQHRSGPRPARGCESGSWGPLMSTL